MKISPVLNINNRSHFKATIQPQSETIKNNKDTNKRDLALLALSAFGIAAIAIHTIKNNDSRTAHELKARAKKITTNFNKKNYTPKRAAEARRRYIYEQNQRKLESLHKRLFNGEFDGKSPEAMEKIIRNEIKLAHATGRLKKA